MCPRSVASGLVFLTLCLLASFQLQAQTYVAEDYQCRVTLPPGPWFVDSTRKADPTNSMKLLLSAKDPVKGKIFLLSVAPTADWVVIDPRDSLTIESFRKGLARHLTIRSEKFTKLGGLPAYAVYGVQQQSDTEAMSVCYTIVVANGYSYVIGDLSREVDPAGDKELDAFVASFAFTSPPKLHTGTKPKKQNSEEIAIYALLAVVVVGVIWLTLRRRRRSPEMRVLHQNEDDGAAPPEEPQQ